MSGLIPSGTGECQNVTRICQLDDAREIASAVHCNFEDTKELVECMKNVPEQNLIGAVNNYYNQTYGPVLTEG